MLSLSVNFFVFQCIVMFVFLCLDNWGLCNTRLTVQRRCVAAASQSYWPQCSLCTCMWCPLAVRGGPKNGLFLWVDNCAMVNGRKAYMAI